MMSPQLLQVANLYQVACVAVASFGCMFLWPQAALATLLGGLVMAANFWALRFLLGKLIHQDKGGSKVAWALILGIKFVVVIGVLTFLVSVLKLHPMGMALGMMALFGGLTLGMIHFSLRGAPQAP